jgi:predicted transcriptional regulator
VRASVKNDHIVCLEDGKKMKMLKRHLMTDHGLTPAEYRARWGCRPTTRWSRPTTPEKRRSARQGDRPRPQAGQRRGRRKKVAE